MGLPMVGKGHRREMRSQEAASRRCQRIPHRVGSTGSSRRSSANHQQPFAAQGPSQDHGQHALGALHFRGTSSEGSVHPRCVHNRRKKLDSASLGSASPGRGEDRRSRAVAPGDKSSRWNQGQDQDVGNSVATIQSRRESQSALEGSAAQARACASVPNAKERLWSCHPNR